VFLTHTTVGGQAVLRVAVGSPATTPAHVERVWTLLREGFDWLAADFAAAAAERAAEAKRAAEREAAARAAEQERVAEPAQVAEASDDGVPALVDAAAVLDETDAAARRTAPTS
jgi:aromatic-L-amino-acid decarboxylase